MVPNFLDESEKFWYNYGTGEGVRYYFVDPEAKVHRELFDREFMAGEISKYTRGPVDSKNLPMDGLAFKKDEKTIKFQVDTFHFEYNIYTRKLVKVAVKPNMGFGYSRRYSNLVGTFSPDSSYIVYAKNHNLFMLSVRDSVETRLTTDGEIKYSYAVYDTDTTTRRVGARIMWFADSKRFYVQRVDRRKVKKLYVVNNLSARPQLREYDYMIPGDQEVEHEELYLVDTMNKEMIKVPVEKWKDQTLRIFTSSRKVKDLYFLRKKRTCDEIDFCRVNPETGEVKVLFNEVSKPYFNEDFFHLSLLNDGEDIIWWSERTGHGHFYHYDGEGNLKNAITSGDWTAGKVIKIDTVGRTIYFGAYGQEKGQCPYYARANKAKIDGHGQVEMLTPEQATHVVFFSKSGRYFVDNYSRADMEPRSVLRDNHGKVVLELVSPDLTRLYEMGWRMPEPFTVKAADGITDLYGFMWKPFDFDSTRVYPIISHVYPGPFTESIPLEFTVNTEYNAALAQVGFIVVTFGHRGGSPMRDKWYHTFGYNNLRDYPLADDKYGLEQLADRFSYIDKSKIGIFGHSGGGFMSTAALCTYPDFYTAAVSSAGNHDNNIYNRWWGETHHGVQEQKSFVKKTVKDSVTGKDTVISVEEVRFETKIPTNMELAKNLRGHLMLVTGDMDNNVHPANTLRMADALLRAGKNFDLVILPGQSHGFFGLANEFFQRKLWYHFAKHLLGDYSSEQFGEIDAYMRL
ncbi:DPP IV N-terminal domain-containing protein [Butyricimonas virosa]|uniref:S9 family peptidase n=1 Tax=Butyricimonas virosa TaxID=544645 RepID=UPI003CFC13CE